MLKSLLLLSCAAACALAQDSVPLEAYKRREGSTDVYKFNLGQFGSLPNLDGFALVNGENFEDGDFSYVKVFPSEKYFGDDCSNCKWDGFAVPYAICAAEFRDRISTHILSSSGCNRGLVSDDVKRNGSLISISQLGHAFYVSRQRTTEVQSIRVTLHQCKASNNRFFFTRLVQGGAGCPQGSRSVYSESFYVLPPNGIACPELGSRNGYLQNRAMTDNVFPTRVELKCNSGYKVEGQGEVECYNGKWSESLGSCERIRCRTPSNLDNGYIDGNDFTYEGQIEYFCDNGYDLLPKYSQTRKCEFNGKWNPEPEPTCEKKSCGSPGDIIYGAMELQGDRFGDSATYSCDEGYRLIGDEQRRCTAERSWTGSLPRCERIMCDALAQPLHGMHSGTGPKSFASGSALFYNCHDGYKLDGASITRCTLNDDLVTARWTNEPPICNAIVCKDPPVNSNVKIEGQDYSFGKTIKFVCTDGYNIEGSSLATCTASGWDTEPPSCSAKMCSNPGIPEHGSRSSDNFKVYATVDFSCEVGYELTPPNDATIICLPTARWNKQAPTCEPVKCPALPPIENGKMSTMKFVYGENITFECFPGYELQGNPEVACTVNGEWDRRPPTCVACPKNSYKSGVNQDTCKPCPARSVTLSPATTSIDHCMCEEGSSKSDDRSCVAIRCVPLKAPDNGSISECEPSSGSVCRFSCNGGFILSGARQRRCLQTGWTGTPPVCTACPLNTYKAAPGSQTCIPCPINSHTEGEIGDSSSSCVCREGYMRLDGLVGGCYDINECQENNGGCSDRCVNTEGGFHCKCSRPGYTLNDDGKTCNLTQTCVPLDQTPTNGNTSCIYNEESNGRVCYFRCRKGYFFVSGENDYVTCGPETRYKWSHQLVNETAKLHPCTEEYFVDTQLPMTFNYSSDMSCQAVIDSREQILNAIMGVVSNFAVCQSKDGSGENRCGLKYLVLNCTTDGDSQKVKVSFEIFLKNKPNPVGEDCGSACTRANMRGMLGDTFTLKTNFEQTVKDEQKKVDLESVDGAEVEVVSSSFSFGRPRLLCLKEGRVYSKNRLCVPCGPGTYLAKKDATRCSACPVGTYQAKSGQTMCEKCLDGSTTADEGSDHPALCSVRVTTIQGQGKRKKRSLDVEIAMTQEEIDEILAFLD